MPSELGFFFLHWAITATSLWIASRVFVGLRFDTPSDLIVSALLLGLVNAFVRPVLIFLTLPLTLLTLGLFLLVINALMMMLVSALVRGFRLSGFGTAFFASILIALVSIALHGLLHPGEVRMDIMPMRTHGTWT